MFIENDEIIMYDLKTKLSSRGKVVEVLGNNTYSVDCGKGLQHVSGDVLSQSSRRPRDDTSRSDEMLTAQDSQDLVQEDLSQDLVQEDMMSDSSSEDEEYYNGVVPAALPRRRRRVRAELLGPTVAQRLRQCH